MFGLIGLGKLLIGAGVLVSIVLGAVLWGEQRCSQRHKIATIEQNWATERRLDAEADKLREQKDRIKEVQRSAANVKDTNTSCSFSPDQLLHLNAYGQGS